MNKMEEYIFSEDHYYNEEYKKIAEEFNTIINYIYDKFNDKFTKNYYYYGFNNFNDNKNIFEYKNIKFLVELLDLIIKIFKN